jgi:hypothetical protein
MEDLIMEDFTVILYVAIVFASGIMALLALGIMALGKLIEKTPDIQELKKEKVRDEEARRSIYAPEQSSKLIAIGFSCVFIIGVLIVVSFGGSKIILILGGVTMFAGLLFGVVTSMIELVIYRTMQKNVIKFNAGEVVGNG